MRSQGLLVSISCLLFFPACMISEQIGEMPQDLAFHFDTDFNRALLFGRSLLLAAFAFWVFRAWGKKAGAILVGTAVLITSGWIFFQDYPSLKGYRVEVVEDGLQLNIPPHPENFVPWSAIERMDLAGYEWMNIGTPGGAGANPFAPKANYAWSELPEWETMDITTRDGEVHTVNLKRLSIEQRQILSQAIVKRARLVKE